MLEDVTKLNNIKDPIVHDTDERRKIIEILAKELGKDHPLVKKSNNELKHYKVMCLVECLGELSNEILVNLQQQKLTTFYSKGRIKAPAGAEKYSARALVMLDKLCELCNMEDEKFKENLKSFKSSLSVKKEGETEEDHIMRYGLSTWYRCEEKNATLAMKQVDKFLGNLKNSTDKEIAESKEKLKVLRGQLLVKKDDISHQLGTIIDYERELVFNLTEAFPLTKTDLDSVDPSKEGSKNDAIKSVINKYFAKGNNDVTFKKIEGKSASKEIDAVIITRKSLKNLTEILSKFYKVASAAFPHLHQNLRSSGKFEEYYDNFLQKEILDNGWNKLMIEDDKTLTEKPLDLKVLKDLINSAIAKSKTEEKKEECVLL